MVGNVNGIFISSIAHTLSGDLPLITHYLALIRVISSEFKVEETLKKCLIRVNINSSNNNLPIIYRLDNILFLFFSLFFF